MLVLGFFKAVAGSPLLNLLLGSTPYIDQRPDCRATGHHVLSADYFSSTGQDPQEGILALIMPLLFVLTTSHSKISLLWGRVRESHHYGAGKSPLWSLSSDPSLSLSTP